MPTVRPSAMPAAPSPALPTQPPATLTLTEWAEAEPQAAILWALHRPRSERIPVLETVLRTTAHRSLAAIAIGRALLESRDPFAADYGTILVGALSEAHEFEAALQFVSQAPAELAADWAAITFHRWGAENLADAGIGFEDLPESATRAAALKGLVAAAAEAHPAALAHFAQTLTTPAERSYALEEAILGWCLQDPAALSAWLDRQPQSPELDLGLAALATRTDNANRPPEMAVVWAQRISDPEFRAKVLAQMASPAGPRF